MCTFTERRERGVAIPEAAVILLAFFVVVLGIMEVGRFMSIQQTLTDAAREGARLAVTPLTQTSTLPTDTAIEDRVNAFLTSNGITGATIVITRDDTAPGIVDRFTKVEARATYNVISLAMFKNLEVTLTGISKMRNETSP